MAGDDLTFFAARLGVDAETFFSTPVGKHVLRKSMAEIEEAQAALLEVDPLDTRAIRDLQNKANIARESVLWLKAAIEDGRAAHEQLKYEDQVNGF